MDLFYPIILISSLIFVHELGHFLFAKAFGVKVLTFSLGFGPKVLKLRGRETEYCISLIPLGGYVRMLEAAKGDVVLPEDRKRTFESLPVYKRIVIVLAGPAMNLIFPVLLYFAVFVGDGPFLPPTVGVVLPGHPAEGKLLPGDRIMAVNGEEVATFDEVTRIITKRPAELLHFKVFRDNRYVNVDVTSEEKIDEEKIEHRELDIVERVGSIGIAASAPSAVIGVPNPESPAYRAGLRTFDIITSVGGVPVKRFKDLSEAFGDNAGETLPITYQRPVSVPNGLGGLADVAVMEAGVVALTPDASGTTLFERTGLELADLYAAVVPDDGYWYKTGLRPGDKILKLDDEPVVAWSSFREKVLAHPDRPHHIDYQAARDGMVHSGSFTVRREDFTDDRGQSFSFYVLQIQHWIPLAPEQRVEHSAPIRYAFEKALAQTADVTHFVLVSIVRLAEGRVSLKSLSGPITIYEVAGEEGRKGADHFIWVMALISINLGLFNLLPIPVLDGGHFLFFLIESLLRRPIPLRARELAHVVGMAILVGLTLLAFKNDLEKRWDSSAAVAKGARG
ncbi:MAG TPA: RIP metalloprotease RseP [Polyangiaceae bacterium]|jgi:regulator of sigma E protease|nr:RIP metalloprotease RseP [Polyangiaceae bacterium]